MKHAIFLSLASTVLLITACKDQTKSAYYDLNRDEDVDLVKDDATGRMIDAKSRQAPYIYVNNETNDTIYGATGEVINGHVIRLEDGKYKYDGLKVKLDEDGDFKLKDDDYKRKVDADGDIKVENGDQKTKIDGETGKAKNK
jgi:hypothetical protein